MTFKYHPSYLQAEEEGDVDLELIAIRYTGDSGSYATSGLRQQGGWPGSTGLTPNRWYIAFVPDRNLTYYESNISLEVRYPPEGVANALLESGSLPNDVFGRASDRRVQELFFEKVGLENVGLGEERYDDYIKQLKEIAGVEEDGEEETPSFLSKSDAEKYADDHTRAELQEEANELGMEGTQSAGKMELAKYILENEEDDE